jgi:hypothetical protein
MALPTTTNHRPTYQQESASRSKQIAYGPSDESTDTLATKVPITVPTWSTDNALHVNQQIAQRQPVTESLR